MLKFVCICLNVKCILMLGHRRKNVESSRRQNTDHWVQETGSRGFIPLLQRNCYNNGPCLATPGLLRRGEPSQHIHHPSGDALAQAEC